MQAIQNITSQPPLGLYIHLPWCIRKCPYCDFNSHSLPSEALSPETQSQYLDALQLDLQTVLPLVWGRVVHSIFIGGGTPSLFSAASIDRLLTMVRTHLRVAADAEITMEANPGTFEQERFEGFAKAGVNRLSIGVQSFSDSKLLQLGRVHSADQARKAIAVAQNSFTTFNVDLMYGLPQQSLSQLQRELDEIDRFNPPHLSYYQLTMEPNTLFAAKPPQLPNDDDLSDMQQLIEGFAREKGYEHYEISAYAKPGHQARHNLNYWQFGDYIGIGAGAHGKLTFHDGIRRYARYKHPATYLEKASQNTPCEIDTLIEPKDLPFEFMLNALRLTSGVPAQFFIDRTGLSPTIMNRAISQACAKGLLDNDPTTYKATPLGLNYLNNLQEMFLPGDKHE